MKLYFRYIFPWLWDKFISKSFPRKKRREILAAAEGKILEIGLGTGLNLPEYPSRIKKITTVDSNPGMNPYAQKRAESSHKKVEHHTITAEKLPMSDQTFDTVVSTWTLCSIAKPNEALKEIHRVLKTGGKFIFIEHGLSRKPHIQKWQKRLTPLWKIFGDGCHIDRDMKKLITAQPFELTQYKEYCMPKMTRLASQMYQGIAIKKG